MASRTNKTKYRITPKSASGSDNDLPISGPFDDFNHINIIKIIIILKINFTNIPHNQLLSGLKNFILTYCE